VRAPTSLGRGTRLKLLVANPTLVMLGVAANICKFPASSLLNELPSSFSVAPPHLFLSLS
jgi:hypothetical protein